MASSEPLSDKQKTLLYGADYANYAGSGDTQAGLQHEAHPHTMEASVGGFVSIVRDVVTGKKNAV